MIANPNWSGYIATAPSGKVLSFKSVTGTVDLPDGRL